MPSRIGAGRLARPEIIPNVPTDFPRYVHKAGGVCRLVADAAERDAAVADGWALTPVLTKEQEQAVRAAKIAAGELVEPEKSKKR